MGMSEPTDDQPDQSRTDERATLLPEEQAAGSDDPQAQARAVLEDSDERTEHPEQTKHESVQTPD
jgi:hypothetical protein